jgi:hypothetical protein
MDTYWYILVHTGTCWYILVHAALKVMKPLPAVVMHFNVIKITRHYVKFCPSSIWFYILAFWRNMLLPSSGLKWKGQECSCTFLFFAPIGPGAPSSRSSRYPNFPCSLARSSLQIFTNYVTKFEEIWYEEMRATYATLIGRSEGKRSLANPRHIWKDIIKVDLERITVMTRFCSGWCPVADPCELSNDPSGSIKTDNFLNYLATISLSSRISVLHSQLCILCRYQLKTVHEYGAVVAWRVAGETKIFEDGQASVSVCPPYILHSHPEVWTRTFGVNRPNNNGICIC